MKKAAIIKWSKKEKDWIVHYQTRNAKIFGSVVMRMFKDFDDDMKKHDPNHTTFREYLIQGNLNPDSLRITIDELPTKS